MSSFMKILKEIFDGRLEISMFWPHSSVSGNTTDTQQTHNHTLQQVLLASSLRPGASTSSLMHPPVDLLPYHNEPTGRLWVTEGGGSYDHTLLIHAVSASEPTGSNRRQSKK